MFKSLNRVISNNSFKLIYVLNKLNIVNYDDILILEDNLILITASSKIIKIKGRDLVIRKLEDKELLIEGIINNINLGD
jgi:hypothetical protein